MTRTAQLARWALVLVVVELAALFVTGMSLYFSYRPSGAASDSIDAVRLVHRYLSHITLLTGLAGAVLAVAAAFEERRRRIGRAALAPAVWVVLLAASFTGYLLPWDQLALWAVTVGTNVHGYEQIIDGDGIRFVIVGGAEVSSQTVARWLWVHMAALPIVVGVLLWRLLRETPAGVAAEEREGALGR